MKTDFEPILTDAEYAINEKMVVTISNRLAEMELALADKVAPHLEAIEAEKEKRYRIINNLKASLYKHKAASHDYWLNSNLTEEESVTGSWQAEVTSLRDLISAAATDPQWEECLLPNTTKLNARARKDKRAMFVPGAVPVRKEK
jgi:hypothetical protein